MSDAFGPDPFGGKGLLVMNRPDKRVWAMPEDVGGGKTRWHLCTQTLADELIERNKELYNANEGKRWGDGQYVASIPMELAMRGDWKAARENRDEKWIRKFLNDLDHRAYRTRPGTV